MAVEQLTKEQLKQRAMWSASRLPALTQNRDWKYDQEMFELIKYCYMGMEKTEQAKALFLIALSNGIIEKEDNVYRIKPLPGEDVESKYPKNYRRKKKS